jgi:putative transposase
MGVSRGTFYRWRAKYGGMDVNDAKRLKSLELENNRLKRVIANLTLDKQMLKDVLSRKWCSRGKPALEGGPIPPSGC